MAGKSEKQLIKDWYNETATAIDIAARQNRTGLSDEAAIESAMSTRVFALIDQLAANNSVEVTDHSEILKKVGPIIKSACQEYIKSNKPEGQASKGWRTMLNGVTRLFGRTKPNVADLMKEAAGVVYKDIEKKLPQYEKNQEIKREESQSEILPGNSVKNSRLLTMFEDNNEPPIGFDAGVARVIKAAVEARQSGAPKAKVQQPDNVLPPAPESFKPKVLAGIHSTLDQGLTPKGTVVSTDPRSVYILPNEELSSKGGVVHKTALPSKTGGASTPTGKGVSS